MVYVMDFINKMDNGFDIVIGENGVLFFGGQCQCIVIVCGLMFDLDVVIVDELVFVLDVLVCVQVLNLMMDLQQELGLFYVFIFYDLLVVEYIVDEVMVMYLGCCVEKGMKD